jgi:hypothetical protein
LLWLLLKVTGSRDKVLTWRLRRWNSANWVKATLQMSTTCKSFPWFFFLICKCQDILFSKLI